MKKGFLSLEYILLTAATLSAISVLILSGVSLYNKNINAIDDYKLEKLHTNLKNNISLIELNNGSKKTIYFETVNEWVFKKSNLNCVIIKNKQKTKEICSNYKITINSAKFIGIGKINIENKNNTIYLNIQSN